MKPMINSSLLRALALAAHRAWPSKWNGGEWAADGGAPDAVRDYLTAMSPGLLLTILDELDAAAPAVLTTTPGTDKATALYLAVGERQTLAAMNAEIEANLGRLGPLDAPAPLPAGQVLSDVPTND